MPPIQLVLYVCGRSVNSIKARSQVAVLLTRLPSDGTELRIVDVLEEPEVADTEGIVATPVLMRVDLEPAIRVIGSLADDTQVASVLGLDSVLEDSTHG